MVEVEIEALDRSPKLSVTLLTLVITAWIVSTVFFYFYSSIKAIRSPLSQIPGPWYAPWTSLHLSFLFARGTIWRYVEQNHVKYGNIIRLGPRQIWVADRDCLKDIISGTDLPKVTMYAEISRDRNSPGLFGEIREVPHKNLRKFLGPAFTVTSVDKLDHFFKGCVGVLLDNYYIESQRNQPGNKCGTFQTDLMRDLHCVALDIMGVSSFGKGFGQIDKVFDPSKIVTKQDKDWSKIPDAIFKGQASRYQFVYVKRILRKIGVNLEFDWPRDMTRAISNLITERKTDAEQASSERIDVLQHMLDEGERPDTGVKMNNQDIIDQMSELLLAGSETTSGTIGCLFLELARNKEVREKLLASLPVLGPDDDIMDSKRVREDPNFTYLEACIKENLRMHPIASELGRRTIKQPYNAGGYEIPPYTVVSASYRRLHRSEDRWEQPERFWPERWLEGSEACGAPTPDMDSYYPFSAGKHSCIGKNFAYAEIRTVSANIFTRFDVEEVGSKEIDFRQYITMQFHDGKWHARLTPRWTKS